MKWKMLFLALFFCFNASIAQEGEFRVLVKLTNLKSNEGKLSVSIYNVPETFPKNHGMLEQQIIDNFTEGEFIITFAGLATGEYAVAGLHDENGDEKMNFNLIGMPKEGYCFSNNVMPKLRAARWEESKFVVEKSEILIEIEMRY